EGFLLHAPMLVFLKDASTRAIAVSAEHERLLGVPREQLIGKTNAESFPPELARRFDAEDARVLRDGGPVQGIHEIRGRIFDTVKFRLRAADGAPLVCGVAEDVTDRHASEATARMAALGTLAAGMAHEINNPLAYVLANVSFAVERLRAQPESRAVDDAVDALDEAVQGAERVRDIVRDLRSFARPPDEGADGPVDVRSPLRAALTMARNEVKHRATVVEDLREPPPVLVNEHRLAQVLLNLVVNAAQAIPEGSASQKEIRLRTGRTSGGDAFVEVEDTGRGMTEEERRRAFEPFYTTKPVGAGLGLGLFLSANIVRASGGRIEVESTPGRGSTFRVVLPAALPGRAVRAGPAAGAPPQASAEPALRILVVDDEPLVGRSVARLLGKQHRVEALTDARVAIERIRAGERWDVVLCDLMMPELSGIEFDERLAELAPELRQRTVYVTGGAFTERAQAFLAAPGRRVLTKPFDGETLRAAIAGFRPFAAITPAAG
ncbi:MAG TPA: ATP-binding protein, partial [Anaeromyxobacteraceae bacterium]|nr:ATP-binding protein [Anaeromyxobacteraceae bacterium]